MSEAETKLKRDLAILTAMAAEMDEYLRSDVLFWPMIVADMPRLTIGGYLMRQHRLVALRSLLSEEDQLKLDEAITTFNEALVEKVVRLEHRAHQEIHARLRQWSEHLKDLSRDAANQDYWATTATTRTMIEELVEMLNRPPYRLEPGVLDELAAYDNNLRKRWQPGDFVWEEGWEPAYPQAQYWWLYGKPR